MPSHDIIDNREEKLLDHVKGLINDSFSVKFAVGYLFISGLESIIDNLSSLEELKILIGSLTNRKTVEQLAEAYQHSFKLKEEINKQIFINASKKSKALMETKDGMKNSLSLIDQSDENQKMINTLKEMIAKDQMKVRVYTQGRLHSKAYIFYYPEERHDNGNAIIGSSNLSLGGLTNNTELNAVVAGNRNHEKLSNWFDRLWEEAEDFDSELMEEIEQSWAVNSVTPYDIYIKTLFNLLQDRSDAQTADELLWESNMPSLTIFQIVAVKQALKIIKDYGGVIVGDVVGMGKTYIGTALLKGCNPN